MPWHIISIGDEAYLYQIFQFLSMLNSPGTSLYQNLGLVGGLIGLMLVLVQAVSSAGRQMNMGALLVGVVFFMVLFGQSTQVELEDYHTGRTDIVNGVPLGTAILGTLVSQGGVELTRIFQQGTAVPGYETLSPDFALNSLAASRALTDGNLCSAGTLACPFYKTFQNYWQKCVIPKYNGLGRATDAQGNLEKGWWNGDPTNTANALSAIDSENQFTMLVDTIHTKDVPPGGGAAVYGMFSTQSCQTVYSDLQKASQDPVVLGSLASAVLAAAHQKIDPSTGVNALITQADTMISSGYGALNNNAAAGQTGGVVASLQQSTTDAQNMMLNAVAWHVKRNAEISGAISPADIANAAVIEQSAQARNVNFASEQSLFTRTLNATLTFFEGVAYGLAPFVAFLIPMGAVGIKFLTRYLQLLLWIFLWLPLMSFVNLFEIMSVLRQMNALAPSLGNGPLTGMVGILQTQYAVGDWIAMGGWLSTSVIGLSGMIVFGSIAAFQSIANAAHGPDTIDSSSLAPSVISSAPMMSVGNQYSSSGGQGLMRTGAGDIQLSAGSGYAAATSFKHSETIKELRGLGMTAQQAEKATYSSAKQWIAGVQAGDIKSAAITKATQAGNTSTESAAQRETATTGKSADVKASIGDQVRFTEGVRGDASAGLQVLGDGAKVDAYTGAENSTTAGINASVGGASSVQSASDHSQMSQATSQSTEGASKSHSLSDSVTTGSSSSTSAGHESNVSSAWSNKAEHALADMKTYEQMNSQQASFAATATVTGQQVAEGLSRNESAFNSVRSAVNDLGGGETFSRLNDQLAQQFPDPREREAVASMSTLQDLSQHSPNMAVREEATQALVKGMIAVNPEIGSSMGSGATSFLNESHSSFQHQVESATSNVSDQASVASNFDTGGRPHVGGAFNSSMAHGIDAHEKSNSAQIDTLSDSGSVAVRTDGSGDMNKLATERKAASKESLTKVVLDGVHPPHRP